MLEWFNPECPFVKKHYGSGNMQKLQEEFTGKGVVWLTIDSSAPGKEGNLTARAGEQEDDRMENEIDRACCSIRTARLAKHMAPRTRRTCSSSIRKAKSIYEGAIDSKAIAESRRHRRARPIT